MRWKGGGTNLDLLQSKVLLSAVSLVVGALGLSYVALTRAERQEVTPPVLDKHDEKASSTTMLERPPP